MNSPKINYATRDIILLSLDLKSRLNQIQIDGENISKIVLYSYKNYRTKYCDVGSWCYSEIKSNTRNDIKNKGKLIDNNSFKQDRLNGVKALIETLLYSDNSAITIASKYKEINSIFSYLNKNYANHDCSNINDANEIFSNYTKYLINIINTKSLGDNQHQVSKQETLAKFLATCCKTNINYFFSKYKKIKCSDNSKQVDKNEISTEPNTQFQILLTIFKKVHSFLFENKNLPLIIDLQKFELPKAYIDLNLINKTEPSVLDLFYNENNISEFHEFNKKLDILFSDKKSTKNLEEKRTLRKKFNYKIRRLEELNKLEFTKCNPKILLFNFLTIVFAKLLIGVSGANESTLYQLELDSFKTISTEKGKRAYSNKKRAHRKKVTIEFKLKFEPIFDQYISLRKKINKLYKGKIDIKIKKLLLINLPVVNNIQSSNIVMASDTVMFDQFNKNYKELFKKTVISNRDLRLNVSNFSLNETNSSLITAMRLGNSTNVVNRHYTRSSFSEVASQISNYFENFDKLIIEKGRESSSRIPVHTISDLENSSKNLNTPVGHCLQRGPELASGFNKEVLPPTCGDLNSCFFCKSYVVHINKNDIKKILSLKYILEYNPHIKDDKKIIIYRINEIIELILENYGQSKKIVDEVQNEVKQGYLDEYWNNHLTMLFELRKDYND